MLSEPARFTGEGRATLADVRNQMRALEGADLTADEQKAITDAQWARVMGVIFEEIEPMDGEGSAMVEDRDEREADDA